MCLWRRLIHLLLIFLIEIGPGRCIRTFYELDLQTENFFEGQGNQLNLCEELGIFYDARNELTLMTKCIRFKPSQLLYCHDGMENFTNYTNKAKLERIESLVICNHSKQNFNISLIKYFTKLRNLFIGESSFDHFATKIPKMENLEFINITRTRLQSIKSDFFSELPSIQLIDLRFNRLSFIERFVFYMNREVKIFLFGNLWNCTKNMKWMGTSDFRFQILDRHRMNCSDTKYRARPVFTVMSHKLALHKSCREEIHDLRNCSCHISYFRLDDETNVFQPMYSVNCSASGFVNFPRRLPDNTTTLFITHNRISSLNMLCTRNSTYNNVQDIYLDYNLIADASVLDNCEWFLKFRVLSLKGNLLEKIPNYAFKNSFEKSQHAIKLYLSENPWLCNCRLHPRLLKLCQKYELIIDQKQIRCLSKSNTPDVYGRHLMELTKSDVCKVDKFPLNIYEMMSIVFSALIILIFVNLLYDYYIYKNYGKLPWIVMHTKLF